MTLPKDRLEAIILSHERALASQCQPPIANGCEVTRKLGFQNRLDMPLELRYDYGIEPVHFCVLLGQNRDGLSV